MITVAELFAGVGGFRLGLEGWNNRSASSSYTQQLNTEFHVIWSNQWEPATRKQHASLVYESRWGSLGHSNQDIASVDIAEIPDHDILVGGFPCQDYSVATTLKNSKGLIGKKGVLWWSIYRILSEKKNKPNYLFLENVDRLLKSPAHQRGRDFAIILQSLNELGYAVEWRVINAADYGMPQRRKRIFILGYLTGSPLYRTLVGTTPFDWISNDGVLAEAFPLSFPQPQCPHTFRLPNDIVEISENFNKQKVTCVFENTGMMLNGLVITMESEPIFDGTRQTLGDILLDDEDVSNEYYISTESIEKWKYLKGAKKIQRKNSNGIEYNYSEGSMLFPDPLDKPSRTIITGEGGATPSRFKHIVRTRRGLRRLTPIELERLDMFPDNHTQLQGISDNKRAFFMGNALVVGVIERIGQVLQHRINND